MTHLGYLNQSFPARKSLAEKEGFRKHIIDSLNKKGIEATVETTQDGKNNNIIIGNPAAAKTVFTAHYDTPASSLFPNIMIPKNRMVFYAYQFVPIIFLLVFSFAFAYLIGDLLFNDERIYYVSFLVAYYGLFFGIMRAFKNKNNYNDNTSGVATILSIADCLSEEELKSVAFILFDNEEKGKKGSKAYYNDHKEQMQDKFLINLDCVGNGDNILFIAQKEAVNCELYKKLEHSFSENANYSLEFLTHKQADSNSDHKNFPKGVACIACKKAKNGLLYTPHIHTCKDTEVNKENIDYLTKNLTVFIRSII